MRRLLLATVFALFASVLTFAGRRLGMSGVRV